MSVFMCVSCFLTLKCLLCLRQLPQGDYVKSLEMATLFIATFLLESAQTQHLVLRRGLLFCRIFSSTCSITHYSISQNISLFCSRFDYFSSSFLNVKNSILCSLITLLQNAICSGTSGLTNQARKPNKEKLSK